MPIRAVLVDALERPQRVYQRVIEQIEGVELVETFFYPEPLIEQLKSGLEVDVVIMDVRMEDELNRQEKHIDGIEAARQIRTFAPRMPIV